MKLYNLVLGLLVKVIIDNVNVLFNEFKKIQLRIQLPKLSVKRQKSLGNKQNALELAEQLYFNEKFLRVVKLANENVDSKSIVDRATKRPVEQVFRALDALDETNLDQIEKFIDDYLHEPGVEIIKAKLSDWQEEPSFLGSLNNQELKQFFKSLNSQWVDLYKQFDSRMLQDNCVSSHLPMKYPFVVPGGRFIEIYYWDTYWTIEGLLVCGMLQTVRQSIENFVEFIKKFGFIPNGSRVYYLNRSQPPYFSQMVMRYFDFCMQSDQLSNAQKEDVKKFVLGEALDCMIKEYAFWMKNKSVDVKISDRRSCKLNVFRANTSRPRPESYFEDLHTASQLNTNEEKEKLYLDIATAAESGIDFSSRWFKDPMNMNTIQTSDLIPVDLNAVMYKNELIISDLSRVKGDLNIARKFKMLSLKRRFAINKILWCADINCWADYNFKTSQFTDHFYVSNLSPLWFDIKPPNNLKETDLIELHLSSLIDNYHGIPYSFINSNQQWDFPNIWAPNQHNLIEFLNKFDQNLALKLARKFFSSIYKGWMSSKAFYEKYNAHTPGERGHGGEYEVQSGFGWTNGVIFKLIELFKDDLFEL